MPSSGSRRPVHHPAWLQRLLSLDRTLSLGCIVTPAEHPWRYRGCALLAHAGDTILLALLGALLWLAAPAVRALAPRLIVVVVAGAMLVAATKYSVRRERPLGEASARWSAAAQHDIYSFPSGHAARVSCLAVSIGQHWPAAWPWLLAWVLGVSVARVAVGAHYWLDIIAGGLLGLGAAVLVGKLCSAPWLAC